MYTNSREAEVALLKRLWQSKETTCPKCGGAVLTPLHKKAKKSSNDWKCPACGKIFRTIGMLRRLPEK